jgi:zinc transporter, ZIP family
VTEAFLWGLLGASSLVLGSLVVFVRRPRHFGLGLVMAFGGGVLFSAVAYELVEESIRITGIDVATATGFFSGALAFFAGDMAIGRMGYGRRKTISGPPPEATGLAIVLGSVLDGVPESAVIGLTLVAGGKVGVAMLVAVFISNLPESIAASTGLLAGGWTRGKVLTLWTGIAIVSAIAAAVGFAIGDSTGDELHAFVLAFAGGAILTMLSTSMVPEAYEDAGKAAGLMTTFGFAVALTISIASAPR